MKKFLVIAAIIILVVTPSIPVQAKSSEMAGMRVFSPIDGTLTKLTQETKTYTIYGVAPYTGDGWQTRATTDLFVIHTGNTYSALGEYARVAIFIDGVLYREIEENPCEGSVCPPAGYLMTREIAIPVDLGDHEITFVNQSDIPAFILDIQSKLPSAIYIPAVTK